MIWVKEVQFQFLETTPTVLMNPQLQSHSGFCDASTHVYAAVVYLVIVSSSTQFVAPHLELLSALLFKLIVSISESLQSILPQLKLQCYTDSQIALYWIRGTSKVWKPFVRNRVSVHHSLWSHCPGVLNPADLLSRGVNTLELAVNQLWRQGLDWLHVDVDSEPTCTPDECAVELKATAIQSHNLVTRLDGQLA